MTKLKRKFCWLITEGIIILMFNPVFAGLVFADSYTRGSWGLVDNIATPISSAMLANTGMVGVVLTIKWKEVGTSEDSYDMALLDRLDERITQAINASKKVVFRISVNPEKTPQWLIDNVSVQKITLLDTNKYRSTFCTNITGPVFWDTIYVAEAKEFINYMGSRYTNNPAVVAVFIGAANWYFQEMTVPHYIGDIHYPEGCSLHNPHLSIVEADLSRLQYNNQAGYDHEAMYHAGSKTLEIIDTYASAFPNQALKLALGVTHDQLEITADVATHRNNYNPAQDLIDYMAAKDYNNRVYIQRSALGLVTPVASEVGEPYSNNQERIWEMVKLHCPLCGLQMVGSATRGADDGCRLNGSISPCPVIETLTNVTDIGLTYQPAFIEYFKVDSENPDLYDTMFYATQIMQNKDTTPPAAPVGLQDTITNKQ